jgi:hypothetical protein
MSVTRQIAGYIVVPLSVFFLHECAGNPRTEDPPILLHFPDKTKPATVRERKLVFRKTDPLFSKKHINPIF